MPSAEHEAIVELLRSLQAEPTAEPEAFDASRERLDGFGDLFPVPAGVDIETLVISGVRCERYAPPAAEEGALIIYLHGGAYVAGSLHSHRAFVARLALAAGIAVIAVEYRLAPENPHPAALDDATAVYLASLADGHDPARIVIAGDSAGGGLATAIMLALPAAQHPLPAGAVLIAPWLDLTLSGESITTVADADPMLSAERLAASATAYGADRLSDPLVSPVFANAEQLGKLPPLLILAGTADILVDDSRAFTTRVRDAGGHVDLDVEDDMIHVWPFLDGVPEAATAMERIVKWVHQRLATSPASTPGQPR